jgi:hypothetical protein
VLFAFKPRSIVLFPVWPSVDPVSMLLIVFILTFVDTAIHPSKLALSFHLISYVGSFKFLSVGESLTTVSFFLTLWVEFSIVC